MKERECMGIGCVELRSRCARFRVHEGGILVYSVPTVEKPCKNFVEAEPANDAQD